MFGTNRHPHLSIPNNRPVQLGTVLTKEEPKDFSAKQVLEEDEAGEVGHVEYAEFAGYSPKKPLLACNHARQHEPLFT